MIDLLVPTTAQGLLWAVMALGVYITYRVLDVADLTVEGSFPLGAAVAASMLSAGYGPIPSFVAAAIAGMLAMNPECIIFDESTAMLDPKGREDILNTILSLRDKGMTVVLITHYMNEAALADNIILVDKGRAIFFGTPEEVFDKGELLVECGLEAPQAKALVKLLEKAGVDIEAGGVLDADDAASVIKKALDKSGK